MLLLLAQEGRQIPVLVPESLDVTAIIVAVITSGAVILGAVIVGGVRLLSLIRGVDRAVNGRSDEEPKLYERVASIDEKISGHDRSIDRLCLRTRGVEKSNNRIAVHLGLESIEPEEPVT